MTSSSPHRLRLIWEFFGPHSGPTAAHFAEHLAQFLRNHAIEAEPHQLSETARAEVHLVLAAESAEPVARALRPRRIEEVHESQPGS